MSKSKHRKAIKATAIVALLSMMPISILMYFHLTRHTIDLENFGSVPDFAYTFSNQPGGITHHDTERYPIVIAVLKDACSAQKSESTCEKALASMNQLKSWVKERIQKKLPNVVNPPPLQLIAMTEGPGLDPSKIPGWRIVEVGEKDSYLVPDVRKNAAHPAYVVVDDSGFYRAYLPMAELENLGKLESVINQVVSNQHLMHYVGQQVLMWEKYKRRSKGETH